MAKAWEESPVNIATLKKHDVAVLLTGGLAHSNLPYASQNLYLKDSGDRLWQTLHLYKEGKVNTILITGGDISLLNKRPITEIDLAKEFLIKNGVPESAVHLEKVAKNTNENAAYSAEIIEELFPNSSILLVTSAYHMKRAKACFQKRGLTITPFPNDYMHSESPIDLMDFSPSPYAFMTSNILAKEMVGLMVYKIMGYV